MSYIGTEPKDIRSFGRTKFDYTASQGQTAFTGADDDGKVLAFTTGQIEVYVNGILMDDSDFTTTGTGTVTLVSAANLNDVVNIVSFESNIPDNDYVPASGGTFTGAVTASNGLTVDDDGATVLTVDRATSDGDIIDIQKGGALVGSIGSAGDRPYFVADNGSSGGGFKMDSLRLMPTDRTGATSDNTYNLGHSTIRWKDLYLGGGIYLGGTGDSNKLEDYEEGTWTPTLPNGGNINNNLSSYVKIGSLVHAYSYVTITSVTNDTNSFRIGGLPFNSTNNANYFAGGSLSYVGSNNAQDWSEPLVYYGNNFVYFHKTDGDGASVKNNQVQGTWPLILTVNYHTH